ncbi:MAG: hypothetical protein CG440_848 [Methanosaeta sp. NSM2]|nr:hypothetical protein [Methanothrix sp.]OYV14066.1 MAG: hypothetical protein CG440_848 [Methanosaeta sp. NSM2]
MDVSFSAWRHSREESLQLKGDSFSFLFDRRYTNRLNRMSRVFFEAYVSATKELAAQEDRFPSLSEIDAKMESGAVYAFKDRLMKNTEFFEEVKISGVSYLVPRALRFVDVAGTYTDLILNFEEGTVVLPTRRKTPLPPESKISIGNEETTGATDAQEEEKILPSPIEEADEEEGSVPSYPQHMPVTYEEISAATGADKAVEAAIPDQVPEPSKEPLASYPSKEPDKPGEEKKMAMPLKAAALLGAAILIVIAAVFLPSFLPSTPTPAGEPILVAYSAYLSNTSNESYLGLDMANPEAMANDIEIALPPDIEGGVVTISHGNNTTVRLNSSSDASVKIYLLGNWTAIPVGLSFAAAEGYDTSLQVHGQDYDITRKNETLILMFNLTGEGVSFEQSYTKKP